MVEVPKAAGAGAREATAALREGMEARGARRITEARRVAGAVELRAASRGAGAARRGADSIIPGWEPREACIVEEAIRATTAVARRVAGVVRREVEPRAAGAVRREAMVVEVREATVGDRAVMGMKVRVDR
jgi:hypothetical protein